jgi:hypothetical protein
MGDAALQVAEVLLDMLGVPNRGLRADDIRARVTTWLTARADLAVARRASRRGGGGGGVPAGPARPRGEPG